MHRLVTILLPYKYYAPSIFSFRGDFRLATSSSTFSPGVQNKLSITPVDPPSKYISCLVLQSPRPRELGTVISVCTIYNQEPRQDSASRSRTKWTGASRIKLEERKSPERPERKLSTHHHLPSSPSRPITPSSIKREARTAA